MLCWVYIDCNMSVIFLFLAEKLDHIPKLILMYRQIPVLFKVDSYHADMLVGNLVYHRRIWAYEVVEIYFEGFGKLGRHTHDSVFVYIPYADSHYP